MSKEFPIASYNKLQCNNVGFNTYPCKLSLTVRPEGGAVARVGVSGECKQRTPISMAANLKHKPNTVVVYNMCVIGSVRNKVIFSRFNKQVNK